ncbi:hypothetical protein CSW62_02315 [Caulobacter sp. FWC2]|nr:hypothetical protein CSW62_02315 [Caulobacter sp. FWC2]
MVDGFAAADTGEILTHVSALAQLFDAHGQRISALILNVTWVRNVAGRRAATQRTLVTEIIQLLGPDFKLEQLPPADPQAPPLQGSQEAITVWLDFFDRFLRASHNRSFTLDPEITWELWERWHQRVVAYLDAGRDELYDITDAELVAMASGASPGKFFRRYLSEMTMAQWSRLTFCAIDDQFEQQVPSWCVGAGLVALGASADQLRAFNEALFGGKTTLRVDLNGERIQSRNDRKRSSPCVLVIVNNTSAAQRWRVENDAFGLIVPMRQYGPLAVALDQLVRMKQFDVVAIEDGLGLSRLPLTDAIGSLRRVRFSASRKKVEHAFAGEDTIVGAETFGALVQELALRAPRSRIKG